MKSTQWSSAGEDESDRSLSEVITTLRRRRNVIYALLVLGLLASILLSLRHRKFKADGSIRIEPGLASAYRISPISAFNGGENATIASDTYVMQSRSLYLQLAREMDLANNADFLGSKPDTHQSLDDPKVRSRVIALMFAKISVVHTSKDEIILVSCKTTSPQLSQNIVNNLINDYITYIFQMHYRANARSSNWLIGQLADLKQQIESDQEALTKLQSKLGIVGIDEKNATYLASASLNDLTKASNDATIDRILAEARYRYLQGSDPNLIEGELQVLSSDSSGNGLLHTLRASEADASTTYSKLRAQFGPNYPDVKQAKAQLDAITAQVKAEEQRILNQAKLSYSATSATENMISGQLNKTRDQVFSAHGDMSKYAILLHDYEAHRTLYEGLVARLREAEFTSGMEAGEIDIVDLADLPVVPEQPGPFLLILGGLVGGLMVGCVLAVLLEALDTKVVSVEQVETLTGFPVLAQVPHSPSTDPRSPAGPARIEAGIAARSHFAESIQSLRTALLLSQFDTPPKVILMTSALPGEGKSTLSTNLAYTFAQHHNKTLLVDCDLRRSRVAERLALPNKTGLSSILSGQRTLENTIIPMPGVENLFVLPAGICPPDPAVLISSPAMIALVAELRKRFDTVIIDCPPVIGLTDVMALSPLVDAKVLVVRQRVSEKNAVKRVRKEFASSHVNLTGFVMNDFDKSMESYANAYYGGYYQDSPREVNS